MYVSIMAVMKPFIRWAAVDQERTPVEHQHVFQKAKLLTLSTSKLGKKMLFNLVRKHIGFWVITMNVDSPPLLTGLLPKIPKVRPLQEHAGQSNRPSGDKEKVKFKSSVFFLFFLWLQWFLHFCFFFLAVFFPSWDASDMPAPHLHRPPPILLRRTDKPKAPRRQGPTLRSIPTPDVQTDHLTLCPSLSITSAADTGSTFDLQYSSKPEQTFIRRAIQMSGEQKASQTISCVSSNVFFLDFCPQSS